MSKPTVGKKIGSFKAATAAHAELKSRDLLGRPYVLYFYPKDDTPGCTLEGKDFRDRHADFARLGVRVLGVSRDTLASHTRFQQKYALPFELVSDADEELCRQFDVIKDKNMYGKKVRGIERSTFLVDAEGVLRKEWRKVKVDGHVAEVLAAAAEL
ncbi:MAG: peroxiredoxin [Lysobacterales bacterium]|nr:MAG: peroxiredoxin [Xanthomonadales bacterium]